MTKNQIDYWRMRTDARLRSQELAETNRANKARERETNRSNQAQEFQKLLDLNESSRTNRARESLTRQANLETQRSNLAREYETRRSNLAKEGLNQQSNNTNLLHLLETQRSNMARENIEQRNHIVSLINASTQSRAQSETSRSNMVREANQRYSNITQRYQQRANERIGIESNAIASQRNKIQSGYLTEQHRSNIQREQYTLSQLEENRRHNMELETLQYANTLAQVLGTGAKLGGVR